MAYTVDGNSTNAPNPVNTGGEEKKDEEKKNGTGSLTDTGQIIDFAGDGQLIAATPGPDEGGGEEMPAEGGGEQPVEEQKPAEKPEEKPVEPIPEPVAVEEEEKKEEPEEAVTEIITPDTQEKPNFKPKEAPEDEDSAATEMYTGEQVQEEEAQKPKQNFLAAQQQPLPPGTITDQWGNPLTNMELMTRGAQNAVQQYQEQFPRMVGAQPQITEEPNPVTPEQPRPVGGNLVVPENYVTMDTTDGSRSVDYGARNPVMSEQTPAKGGNLVVPENYVVYDTADGFRSVDYDTRQPNPVTPNAEAPQGTGGTPNATAVPGAAPLTTQSPNAGPNAEAAPNTEAQSEGVTANSPVVASYQLDEDGNPIVPQPQAGNPVMPEEPQTESGAVPENYTAPNPVSPETAPAPEGEPALELVPDVQTALDNIGAQYEPAGQTPMPTEMEQRLMDALPETMTPEQKYEYAQYMERMLTEAGRQGMDIGQMYNDLMKNPSAYFDNYLGAATGQMEVPDSVPQVDKEGNLNDTLMNILNDMVPQYNEEGLKVGEDHRYRADDILNLFADPNWWNGTNEGTPQMAGDGYRGVVVPPGVEQVLAKSQYSAAGSGDYSEVVRMTNYQYNKLTNDFINANPALKILYLQGRLSAEDIANFFFKKLIVRNGGTYNGAYRQFARGGGGGRRGGGGGGYSSGGGGSKSASAQKMNRLYNIMKNWSF